MMSWMLPFMLLSACSDYNFAGDKGASAGADEDTATPTDDGPDDSGGGPVDTGTGEPPDDETGDGGAPDDACRSIVIYSTESRADRANYLGYFDELPGLLEPEGYDVTIYEHASAGPLTEAMLAHASELWLFGTDRDTTSVLSDSEAAAAIAFAEAGGGLLIASDHSDPTYSYNEDVNPVAEYFGVHFDGKLDEGVVGTAVPVEDPTGPLVEGVASLPALTTVGLLEPVDASVEVAFSLVGSSAVAWRDDGARVVFDRTWVRWAKDHFSEYDQTALILNVARFLDPCPAD